MGTIKARVKDEYGELRIMMLIFIGRCTKDNMFDKYVVIEDVDREVYVSKHTVDDTTYYNAIVDAFTNDRVDLVALGEFVYDKEEKIYMYK